MSLLEDFSLLDQAYPDPDLPKLDYEPTFTPAAAMNNITDVMGYPGAYQNMVVGPQLTMLNGYISPYPSTCWGGNSGMLDTLMEEVRLPAFNDGKLDPNKIFTSEMSNFKKIAGEQQKILNMFERKLMESLTDKGKFGLTEDDINAMGILTGARAQMSNIVKEQVAVKKAIAELKIKQQQAIAKANAAAASDDGGLKPASTIEMGRSMLDNLFNMSTNNIPPVQADNFETVSPESVGSLLDGLSDQDSSLSVDKFTEYENHKPTTFVECGPNGEDPSYITLGADGEEIFDYPNPTTNITSVNVIDGKAVDEILMTYPVKIRE